LHQNPREVPPCQLSAKIRRSVLADIKKLAKRIALGRQWMAAKIYEAIGRLKERYTAYASLLAKVCTPLILS
jgi:hypothetical protein